MSFWTSKSGMPINGSDEYCFTGGFAAIPDGTQAQAMIKSFELKESQDYAPRYSIRWKLMDGKFKGREVNQNIYAFERDAEKADKALNMMMRIYKLCGYVPKHEDAPTNNDLMPMQGKVCSIKISLYVGKKDGKEYNNVVEVHAGGVLPTIEGVSPSIVESSPIETAFSRNNNASFDDDFL